MKFKKTLESNFNYPNIEVKQLLLKLVISTYIEIL